MRLRTSFLEDIFHHPYIICPVLWVIYRYISRILTLVLSAKEQLSLPYCISPIYQLLDELNAYLNQAIIQKMIRNFKNLVNLFLYIIMYLTDNGLQINELHKIFATLVVALKGNLSTGSTTAIQAIAGPISRNYVSVESKNQHKIRFPFLKSTQHSCSTSQRYYVDIPGWLNQQNSFIL